MRAAHPTHASSSPAGAASARAEDLLIMRLLDALVREDVVGLRSSGVVEHRADGAWLRRSARPGPDVIVPVGPGGFQGDLAVRGPEIVCAGQTVRGYGDVLAVLAELADPVDRPGFVTLARECADTLLTLDVHARTGAETARRLAAEHGPDPADWRGPHSSLAFDTLAARCDHPVYPLRGRAGMDEPDLRTYAPELHPRFALRSLAVPRDRVTWSGEPADLPWFPAPPHLAATHTVLPIHPLTASGPLENALRATGITDAQLLDEPGPDVVPTLSMRTVALVDDPRVHLKVPLATSSLGHRNRRTMKPGTLVDGAAAAELLPRIADQDPRFRERILHADESRHLHVGHELLACLVRRHPADLDDAVALPLAALTAPLPVPEGALVIEALADRFYDGRPLALLDDLFTLLLDWQLHLFDLGVALESHQQNVSLALDDCSSRGPRLRLLFKDDDGLRIHPRAADHLGTEVLSAFDDRRIVTDDDDALVDLFTTITLHLCTAAVALDCERAGLIPPRSGLRLLRRRLVAAVDALPHPGPRARLHERVIRAPRLPVKAMVTAGTLLSKDRSEAADVNKHYTDGPNSLLDA